MKPGRRAAAIGLAAALIVVAGVASGLLVVRAERSPSPLADDRPPAGQVAQPPPSTTPPTSEPPLPQPAPIVAGWQGVGELGYGMAYDVPSNWKPKAQAIAGFGDDTGQIDVDWVRALAPSYYMDGYCSGDRQRGFVGVTHSAAEDPRVAAVEVADQWAALAYADEVGTPPTVTEGEPAGIESNGLAGVAGSATAVAPGAGECDKPGGTVYTFAVDRDSTDLGAGCVVLVAVMDTGFPEALPPTVVAQIQQTFRIWR